MKFQPGKSVKIDDVSVLQKSTSTATTDKKLNIGRWRQNVDLFVDTSGSATLTVEVSTDDSTWRQLDTVSYSSATTEVEQYSTVYPYVRASVDSSLNTLEIVSGGV